MLPVPIAMLRVALIALVGVLLFTFYHRAEHFDEAWFAEQSYWLVNDGWVHSELFRGFNGWDDRIYVFHKLFVYAEALLMSFIGFSLPATKLLTSLCACLTGYLIWRYNRFASKSQRWLALILYVGCGTIIRYFAVGRPEMMCMLLGFASYCVLDSERTYRQRALWAGVLAGMAALTHLNGVVYLLAGGAWLLIREGWRPVIWFGVAGGLVVSVYAADALADHHLSVLFRQFIHDPATQANFKLEDKWKVMLDYHQLFFHSHGEVPLTVLTLLCLLLFFKQLSFKQPVLLYLTLLFVGFWLLTKSVFDFYYILFVPWLALFVAACLTNAEWAGPRWQRVAFTGLLVGYYGFAWFSIGNVLEENYTTPYVPAYNRVLAQHMPHHQTRIIAPLSFFFGQIEAYQIHGLTYYSLKHGRASLNEFFALADKENAKYVMSDGYATAGYVIPLNAPDRIGAYKRIFRDHMTTIYEHQ